MIDTTQDSFARLVERGYELLLHSITGTFRWDIEYTGSWGCVDAFGGGRVDTSAMGDSSQ